MWEESNYSITISSLSKCIICVVTNFQCGWKGWILFRRCVLLLLLLLLLFFIFMSFSLKFRSLSSFLGVTIKYITIFVPIDTDLLNAHALFSPSHCLTMSLIYVVHTPEHSPHACSPQEEKKEEYLYVMFLSLLRASLIHFLKFVHKLKT